MNRTGRQVVKSPFSRSYASPPGTSRHEALFVIACHPLKTKQTLTSSVGVCPVRGLGVVSEKWMKKEHMKSRLDRQRFPLSAGDGWLNHERSNQNKRNS
jgi:hypothetical protein